VGHWILEGPPWVQLVDEDEAYIREQVASLGSRLLEGWCQANLGGAVEEGPETAAITEIREEIKRIRQAARNKPTKH